MNDNNPFNIIGNPPPASGEPLTSVDKNLDLTAQIESIIGSADIVLFMKGTPDFPQCGFSANVIGILNSMGVGYRTFDILADMDIRQGIKDYANWPTFPQLWVKKQLIGGNDIISEMYEAGELKAALE